MDTQTRAELVAKVREAIAAVGLDPADPDLYAMAEATVDAMALALSSRNLRPGTNRT
jgi:hypothetical protein